jgi:tRNA pseudouridine65 synthase
MVSGQILFRDPAFVAVYKAPGVHVHKPEDRRARVPLKETLLWQAEQSVGVRVYAIHRIDFAAEGIVLCAIDRGVGGVLNQMLARGEVDKQYEIVVRGWVPPAGVIDDDLELDSTGEPVSARTEFQALSRLEMPDRLGKRDLPARYTWVSVQPRTGRWHQIRRHFKRRGHPVVGDSTHGDLVHNRYFRDRLGVPGLLLLAKSMRLKHPFSGEEIVIHSGASERWTRLREELPWQV